MTYIHSMNWQEYFDYDSGAGVLIRRVRPRHHFPTERGWRQVSGRDAGKPVTCKRDDGYVMFNTGGRTYRAHRVIWEMHNGPIPDGFEIDHINGDRADNRLCNLRVATRSQNSCNIGIRINNTSGHTGVSWSKRAGKWEAWIKANGRRVGLGHYKDIAEAVAARQRASAEHYGQFARP